MSWCSASAESATIPPPLECEAPATPYTSAQPEEMSTSKVCSSPAMSGDSVDNHLVLGHQAFATPAVQPCLQRPPVFLWLRYRVYHVSPSECLWHNISRYFCPYAYYTRLLTGPHPQAVPSLRATERFRFTRARRSVALRCKPRRIRRNWRIRQTFDQARQITRFSGCHVSHL